MQKTTPRAFTRTDVEQFFNSHWGASDYPKNELLNVALLPELDPPTWLIHYQATWSNNDVNYYDLVVTQFPTSLTDQPYYLNLVTEVEIPAGFKSVTEEDAEIKRREEAEHAKWEKREQAKPIETA